MRKEHQTGEGKHEEKEERTKTMREQEIPSLTHLPRYSLDLSYNGENPYMFHKNYY
jgi:hypothetical protein